MTTKRSKRTKASKTLSAEEMTAAITKLTREMIDVWACLKILDGNAKRQTA